MSHRPPADCCLSWSMASRADGLADGLAVWQQPFEAIECIDRGGYPC